jgi:hypothetical protein
LGHGRIADAESTTNDCKTFSCVFAEQEDLIFSGHARGFANDGFNGLADIRNGNLIGQLYQDRTIQV